MYILLIVQRYIYIYMNITDAPYVEIFLVLVQQNVTHNTETFKFIYKHAFFNFP